MSSFSIILQLLEKSTPYSCKTKFLAEKTGLSIRTIQRVMKKLTADGLVIRVGRGEYRLVRQLSVDIEKYSENDTNIYSTNSQTDKLSCQSDSDNVTAGVLRIDPQKRAEYEKRRRHLWALAANIQEVMGVDEARKEAIYRILYKFFQNDWELLKYVNTFAVSYAVNVTLKAVTDRNRFVRNPLAYCVGVLKNVALQNRDRFVLEKQAVVLGEGHAVEIAEEVGGVSAEEAAVSIDSEADEVSVSQNTICVSSEARCLAENMADMLLSKGMTWYSRADVRERLCKSVQVLLDKGISESDIHMLVNKVVNDSFWAASIRVFPEALLTFIEKDWCDEQYKHANEPKGE